MGTQIIGVYRFGGIYNEPRGDSPVQSNGGRKAPIQRIRAGLAYARNLAGTVVFGREPVDRLARSE